MKVLHDKIKKRVNYLIKKYGTRNPFELAKAMGIEVTIGPLDDIWGAYLYVKRRRVIFLNEDLNEYERIIVMAHELGHAELHRYENCYFIKNKTLLLTSKLEIQANCFAAELLIDECAISGSYLEQITLDEVACHFCVPVELVKLKEF